MTPEQIREWALARHSDYLRTIVTGEVFFPKEVRFGRASPTEDFRRLKTQFDSLAAGAVRIGYCIAWEERNTARWGRQRFPVRVWFEDETGFATATGKATELAKFRRNLGLTREQRPELEEWMRKNARRIVEAGEDWPGVLRVCSYFLKNPQPQLYARQLPINVPTKFIDGHHDLLRSVLDFLIGNHADPAARTFDARFHLLEDEAHVRLRFLDDSLRLSSEFPVTDATLPVSSFRTLSIRPKIAIVAENKMCFLTLPPKADAIALFGAGKAAALLHGTPWLQNCRLFYWGDMDDTGFNILSQLRAEYPRTESLLMNAAAWHEHRQLAEPGRLDAVPPLRLALTPDEEAAWREARDGGLMIEQEKIPIDAVNRALAKLRE